jgi:hypothetical protein
MLGDEVISPQLQKELDSRVAEAGGDIEVVKQQLEAELHDIENAETDSDSSSARRRDIALILGEIKYLDEEELEAEKANKAEHPSLMTRMRHALHMNG